MDKLVIAVGHSRLSKYWKNTEITWEGLVERLKNTTRTAETQGEYFNMAKSQQDGIKDVGGFVGGRLKGGVRKAANIDKRYIVTLDADFASVDFCDALRLFSTYSWCVYSTHKHTPEKPRLRLVIPLNRPVTPDEYEAVARRAAADIGIDMFDDTTFQAHRIMYWPSTSLDGEFVFDFETAKPLDVDAELARYGDWRDISRWPVSCRAAAVKDRDIKKQQDPETKKGLIGAFCRAYTVPEAIEAFIPGVYIECGMGGRYTYAAGSTSAGAVLYENGKFIYSNHATDPAGGKLCNAFDIVRIHKFGDLDEDTDEKTPVNKTPSFIAMQELAADDAKVKRLLYKERTEDAKSGFDEADDDSWLDNLLLDKKGNCISNIENAKLILSNDMRLKGRFAYNEFSNRFAVTGTLPWSVKKESGERDWTDTDDAGLRLFFEKYYKMKGKSVIEDAFALAVKENGFNPVTDYLNSLLWDGRARVETLFIDYLGAEDNGYIRAVTKMAVAGAAARAFVPGIKFDTMPVLVGEQGCGKSQIIKAIGREWYSDTMTTMQGKEAYEQIQGFWIIEIPELAAMKRMEVEAIKHFISKCEDAYRPAYGRRTEKFKRQCVFFGTTNTYEFMKDTTGGRRFWPVDVNPGRKTKDIWKDLTDYEIDQLWAEAVYMFKSGEEIFINNKELEKMAKEQQEAHRETSPLEGVIKEYIGMPVPDNWAEMSLGERRFYIGSHGLEGNPECKKKRDRICAAEVWCELLGGDLQEMNRQKSLEITAILGSLEGVERGDNLMRFGKIYGHQRGFRIKNDIE